MKPENRSAFNFINSYMKRYWRLVIYGTLAIIFSSYLQTIIPVITADAIDFIRTAHSGQPYELASLYRFLFADDMLPGTVLLWLGIALTIVAALLAIVRILSRVFLISISRHVEYDMLNDYLRHLQKMSQYFFQRNKTGDLMSRATSDISAIRRLTGPAIIQFSSTLVMFIFALYFMFRISIPLTLVALSPLPLIVFIVYSRVGKIHALFNLIQEQISTLTSRAQENFSGIRVIKSYVREKFEIDAFRRESDEYIKRNISLARVDSFLHAWLEFLLGLGVIAVIWLGGRQVIDGSITLGQLVAMLSYVGMLAWPMISVGILLNTWQRGLAAAQRVQEVLNAPVDIKENDAAAIDIGGAIEFKNVSFTYPGTEKAVLRDISIQVQKGKKLAIVGATGAGKSTLVHLIPRLYEPTAGQILIDGVDIRTIPLQVLRHSIGFVQQESFLFSDSIADNIAFGVVEQDQEALIRAAAASQLALDIDQFPDGLETIIGERGITLSGGQKQRTSISRAILKQPRILILDDALSAVDTYTEEEILRAIRPIMHERTTIIVAHRISTIRDADHIIVLQDGAIAEQGTHQQLLNIKGIYFDMHQRQKLEETLREIN
ncbi:ABC transporter ATP-binding protein [candidate division KSB1 bacterium]|nr:ABC transporter ATP-binding protein [candidate division KSB1 bacterium]RQW10754.1 MAG: ABC transporter ATP-binding protein [candidate division KSB1 bacterium]